MQLGAVPALGTIPTELLIQGAAKVAAIASPGLVPCSTVGSMRLPSPNSFQALITTSGGWEAGLSWALVFVRVIASLTKPANILTGSAIPHKVTELIGVHLEKLHLWKMHFELRKSRYE